jgi:sugar O-acyltransferase (sialic acid O-acetyltransferase NeuD family)
MTTLYLCGAGNPEGVRLALAINEAQKKWEKIILLDDDPSKQGQSILGVKIAGPFDLLGQVNSASAEVVNLVARTTRKRLSAMHKIEAYGLPFASLIDPGADMMGVDVNRDITVYRDALFCANATVDEGSVFFAGAIVGHGCRLGRCCVVAPGAVINARVELGEGVYIGTNASILPDLKIGAWATIGANSAVIRDVPAGATVMGVPAQMLMMSSEDVSGESTNGPERKRGGSEQTEIRSDGLRKLRTAQEKYIQSHRSTKT